jgi:hypothetical protein
VTNIASETSNLTADERLEKRESHADAIEIPLAETWRQDDCGVSGLDGENDVFNKATTR